MNNYLSELTKIICSHGRSQIYLIESIISAVEKNCTFWAHDWDLTFEDVDELISVDCDRPENHQKCVEMGINAEKYARTGTYFTVTSGTSPYCRKFVKKRLFLNKNFLIAQMNLIIFFRRG